MRVVGHLGELEAMQDSLKDTSLQLPASSLAHLKEVVHGLRDNVEKMKAILLEFEARSKAGKDGQRDIPKFKWARERKAIIELRDSVRRQRSFLSDALLSLQTVLGIRHR